MDRQAALMEAAGRLYECGSAGEEIALGPISTAMGASYTLLFAENPAQSRIDSTAIVGLGTDYLSRLSEAAVERIMPKWLRNLGVGTVLDRSALQHDQDFTTSQFFDHVVRPAGKFHCLVATPYTTPLHRYHLIVGRPFSRQDFGSADIRVLEALLPHVGRVIAMEERLHETSRLSESLKCVVDRLATNIVVVSASGVVEYANSGGERILSARDGLTRSFMGLAAGNSDATVVLRRAVRELAGGEVNASISLALERPSGRAPLNVTLTPLSRPRVGSAEGADQRQVMLVIQEQPERAQDGRGFGLRYGLTSKEREVVVCLSQGQNLQAAARSLAIGYNTARSHLRRVFEKTGTHRQSELVRLLVQSDPGLRCDRD